MSSVRVLDTSVLLSTGKAGLFAYPGDMIVLPLVVVKELESKRNDPDLGLYARDVLRAIEELRSTEGGTLSEGKTLDNGSVLRIETNHVDAPSGLPSAIRNDTTHDTRILVVAKNLADEGNDVVVVSKDLPMRILAEAVMGLKSEDFTQEVLPAENIDDIRTVHVSTPDIDSFYGHGFLPLADDLPLNAPVILKGDDKSASGLALAKPGYRVDRINYDNRYLKPKSTEQSFALGMLNDDAIKIVSLGGRAGTGKTLLAIAAGLEQVMTGGTSYQKVTVFRPVNAVGNQDIGFLPGTIAEKMDPVSDAIYDSLRAIMTADQIKSVRSHEYLEVLPLTHIRGRTLPKTWVVIDEAQNLEKNVLMTALTRLGNGSKAVLCYDLEQRDNLRVGKHDGIFNVAQSLYGEKLFGHVTFKKTERSEVADLINRRLLS